MTKSNYPYRNLEDAWKETADGIELKYPIFHHDLSIPNDPKIKSTIEEVIGDIDFWGWEVNEEVRIVDSTGKVFFSKFENTEDKIIFIIPFTRHSGVVPGELERTLEVSEVKTIMISGIENNEVRIKENISELKLKINSLGSIEEILKTCSKYF
jgi:hypothetical protein